MIDMPCWKEQQHQSSKKWILDMTNLTAVVVITHR